MTEYENEPVPGLPGRPPAGERILWQGAPNAGVLAVDAFHVRKVALYFALLMAWRVLDVAGGGATWSEALFAGLVLLPLALLALGLLCLIAWASARSTLYTITNRRVALRFGVALPMVVNLPFQKVQSAALRRGGDDTGALLLELEGEDRIAYLALWPHVRPWQFGRPQPMLRALPDAVHAADVLSAALAEHAGHDAPPRVARAAGRADGRPSLPVVAATAR